MILKKANMAKMKSFNEKIDALLVNLKIEKPKAPKYIEHIYADFIEINAFFLKNPLKSINSCDTLCYSVFLHKTNDRHHRTQKGPGIIQK